MHRTVRTNSEHQDFIDLVKLLDDDLALRDGEDHAFYNQFNSIDALKHAIVLYENDHPIACGAIKEVDHSVVEVKRMYTLPKFRGKGLATKLLKELETWAQEMNYQKCILETGKRQPEAIQLYLKNNYHIIPNYGQYEGIENSVCFEKVLKQ